jgi:hypothetical protein
MGRQGPDLQDDGVGLYKPITWNWRLVILTTFHCHDTKLSHAHIHITSKIVEDVVNKVGSSAWSNADFERFVYADVATEPNGMELSVLVRVVAEGPRSVARSSTTCAASPVCGG